MNRRKIVLVVASVMLASPLFAQDPDVVPGEDQLEEVMVTAQRREQNLQDVPISVSVFGAKAIQDQNIKSAIDYMILTPNVSYTEDGQTGKRGAGVSIRGVNNLISGENARVSSIGVYLDGFSVASVPNQFANPELPDMSQVEVLRGPQGTLYGRSAVGGALNLSTANPSDEEEYQVFLNAEDFHDAGGQFGVTGVANFPVSDTFKLRAVVHYVDNSGYVKNICRRGATQEECPIAALNDYVPNGAKDSGNEYFMGRLKASWDVTDQTNVLASFYYAAEDQGHDENVPSGIIDLDSMDTLGIEQAYDPGTGFYSDGNYNRLAHDLDEHNDLDTFIGVLNVTHTYNDSLALHWITGVITADFDRLFDQDLIGGADALSRDNHYEGTSWSSELRLEGNSSAIDWVVGAMISNDDQKQHNNVAVSTNPTAAIADPYVGVLPPFPTGLGLALNDKSFEFEGYAVFADMTFHASDQWDIIAGGRYAHDKVTTKLASWGIGPTCCFPGSPGYPGGPGYDFFQSFENFPRPNADGDNDFSDFAPRFGARYQATEEVGFYGMISKGYKAGGDSVGNNTNAPGQPAVVIPFGKETLWAYELGMKSELMEDRLRLNAAVFLNEWHDMQMESFRFLTPGDLSSNFEQTINLDKADAFGVEFEWEYLITEHFVWSGAVGYLDTEIHDNQLVTLTGGYEVVLDGLVLPKAPEWTFNTAGQYDFALGDGDAWVRLEYAYREGQYSDIEGISNQQTLGPAPNSGLSRPIGPNEYPYLSPDVSIFNLRLGWEKDNWGVILYAQNLFDNEYYTGTQENFGASGIRVRPHPRVIGVNLNVAFGESEPAPAPPAPRPATPVAAAPPPNPDLDGDGVLNEKDKCPDTRKGAVVDLDGCEVEAVIALDNVHFAFDSAELTAEGKAILDKAAGLLKTHDKVVVEVAGHTDNVGSEEYNLQLSDRRAASAKAYLESQGITASRMTSKGYGETQPVASNDTAEGRALNRRVELIVLDR